MFTAILICPRRVLPSFVRVGMTRQQTLAKFFTMPPGKRAPPQQSSLTDLWGSKPKTQNAPAAKGDSHPVSESATTVDARPTTSSSTRA
ncbi:hypothetical protein F5148DRAFT_1190270 [Russula earlei]|uniref:Uncharacterized protein n=1 Tax=Russula earlei TaxID=71964 RepID=A0ACC0UBK0_9AGAM|nr:hypothetical protein F5148DRAFT_1190270 [Russula earlei]